MKKIIGYVMLIISIISVIMNGIYYNYLTYANLDMTQARILYEHPEVILSAIVAVLLTFIGGILAKIK